MVPLARRNLLFEKTRLIVAVSGVAFSVFLVILIQGVYYDLRNTFTAFIDEVPAQLWVTQDGAFDMFHSTSALDEGLAGRLAQVDGVLGAQEIVAGQLGFHSERGDVRTFVAAFSPQLPEAADAFGITEPPRPGEIVISELARRQSGLSVGDELSLGGDTFRIVETVDKDLGFRSLSFMAFTDAQPLLAHAGSVNYYTLYLDDGSDREAVGDEIKTRVPGVDVFTREEFASSSRGEMSSFRPIVAVLTVIAFIVGGAVIAITIYTATVERAREYGVLKAIGASGNQLYGVVLYQSLLVGLAGFAIGMPLAIAGSSVIERAVPEFSAVFYTRPILLVLVGVVVMSAAAALVPVRRLANIEPATVFRA